MDHNAYESLAKGIVALLHAKKIITTDEHIMLSDTMRLGQPHNQLGNTMQLIASEILKKENRGD